MKRASALACVSAVLGVAAPPAAAQESARRTQTTADASPPTTTTPATTRPAVRRMTWDRVRVDADLQRRLAEARRELAAAEARHAANPNDAGAARAAEAARRTLEKVQAANDNDRKALGAEFLLEKAAYLGVATSPAPAVLRKQLRLPDGVGLLVDYVEPGSPAEDAGLQAYDVALRLNEQILVNPQQLAVLVRTFDPGAAVNLTVVREAKEAALSVKLEQRDVKPLEHVIFGDQPLGHADFVAEVLGVEEPASPVPAAVTVRAGDQLLVTVRDLQGPGQQTHELVGVNETGDVRLPYLKRSVRAAGLSEVQLKKVVADAYRAANVHHVNVTLARRGGDGDGGPNAPESSPAPRNK